MVIEWLKVKVAPELRQRYVEKDAEIWTPGLSKYPGFIRKEVWLNPDDPAELALIIYWESREHWKSIPQEHLQQLVQQFDQAMESNDYHFTEEAEYQLHAAEP